MSSANNFWFLCARQRESIRTTFVVNYNWINHRTKFRTLVMCTEITVLFPLAHFCLVSLRLKRIWKKIRTLSCEHGQCRGVMLMEKKGTRNSHISHWMNWKFVAYKARPLVWNWSSNYVKAHRARSMFCRCAGDQNETRKKCDEKKKQQHI